MKSKVYYGFIIDCMYTYDWTIEEIAIAMGVSPVIVCKKVCGLVKTTLGDILNLAENIKRIDKFVLLNSIEKDLSNIVYIETNKKNAYFIEYLLCDEQRLEKLVNLVKSK